MANKKTEKCPFLSDYGGGYIRPDQWVTEKLCAIISKKENSELPDKFWNLPQWKQTFRRQVQLASALLILYDAEPISRALKDKRSYNLRSFSAFNSVGFFAKILDEYQNKYEVEKRSQLDSEELPTRSTNVIPTHKTRNNKLSRLKNIDAQTRPVQSG